MCEGKGFSMDAVAADEEAGITTSTMFLTH